MRNWEDILKDKLDGYESPLPEGGLADFRARRDGAAPAAKRYSLAGVVAGAAVAAAGLAAVLLLPRPAAPDDAVQVVQEQAVAEVVVAEAEAVAEAVPALARPGAAKPARRNAALPQEAASVPAEAAVAPADEPAGEPAAPAAEETPSTEPSIDTKPTPNEAQWADSPFVPQRPAERKVRLKVAPAAGAVAGGGLLAAVLTPWARGGTHSASAASYFSANSSVDNVYNMIGNNSYWNAHNLGTNNPSPYSYEAEAQNLASNVLSGEYTHYRPLKAGLSVRIPLSEKLSVTTGLTYSLYASKFTYTQSGEMAQRAHYLGLPVRLDYTLATNQWLDVYVGAGLSGDLCLGSTLGGNAFAKDGPSLSLLAAGGLQWNMTPRLGLYLEPELSWTAPSDRHLLQTYRQEHPLLFTLSTGLRLTLGNL